MTQQSAGQTPNGKRVLITGCAGFIGSILTETLLSNGYHVTGVDNLMYGPAPLFHLAQHPEFEFVQGDVQSPMEFYSGIANADVVIPLAAIVGAPACERNPGEAWRTNFEAIEWMFDDYISDEQLVIFPNTNSGYGTTDSNVPCIEDTPLNPISRYGRAKQDAEAIVLEHPHSIALRLATVFGTSPRMRLDLLVNDFVYRAVTDGYLMLYEPHYKRNYIHIRDVSDCFVHCIQNADAMTGRAFNVGLDSANLSKAELADRIREHVPNLEIRYADIGTDPDQRNYVVSNQRLREAGFEATRTLDQGIQELIKGYRMMGRGMYRNA